MVLFLGDTARLLLLVLGFAISLVLNTVLATLSFSANAIKGYADMYSLLGRSYLAKAKAILK